MEEATVNLKIPANIYEHAQLVARETNCSPESLLLNGLAALFSPTPTEIDSPDALDAFDDHQLWAIVYTRLTPKQEARLHELLDMGNQGELCGRDEDEMRQLVALVTEQMLQRSKALAQLQKRGRDITHYINSFAA